MMHARHFLRLSEDRRYAARTARWWCLVMVPLAACAHGPEPEGRLSLVASGAGSLAAAELRLTFTSSTASPVVEQLPFPSASTPFALGLTLPVGQWTLLAEALDASGDVVAQGSVVFEIVAGQATSVAVVLHEVASPPSHGSADVTLVVNERPRLQYAILLPAVVGPQENARLVVAATDDGPNLRVDAILDGEPPIPVAPSGQDRFETLLAAPMAEGAYDLEVVLTDDQGLTTTVTMTLAVQSTPCAPGQVPLPSGCTTLCSDDSDCPSGESCVGGLCTAPSAPLVMGIDGKGSPDPAPGHAPHHFAGAPIISGHNLGGVAIGRREAVTFSSLFLREATPTRVVAELPGALVPGDYSLSVANAGLPSLRDLIYVR